MHILRLLLDTHIFLWFISGDKRLPEYMKESIRDPNNQVYLSVVSVWEAIIKQKLGKLPLPKPAESYLPAKREQHLISSLPINEAAVIRLAQLPLLHKDPFDRMLICQSIEHDLTIVTVDDAIRNYPMVKLLDKV